MWVKFPVMACDLSRDIRTTRPASSATAAVRRYLDDDAVDDPRQPRDQLLAKDRLRPLRGHRCARRTIGRRSATLLILADKLADEVLKAARVDGLREASPTCRPPTSPASSALIRCKVRRGYDFPVPLLAGDHVTDDTGTGFVHTAPGHGREDFDIWMANAASSRRAASTPRIPYTVDADGFFTEATRPGFDRQARHHRQGRQGRRQRGGDQGADRRRHADRARPAQAPVSAFLALQEAGDLPQHAAMVHRHG